MLIGYILLIISVSSIPGNSIPRFILLSWDKLLHLVEYSILGYLAVNSFRAISKNYKTSYPPSNRFLNKISKIHFGYRSVFTWYMWRSIDPTDVEY